MKASALLFVAVAALGFGCGNKDKSAGDPAAKPAAGTGAAPTPTPTPSGSGPVKIDGSSTVFLISQAVAEEYERAGNGRVTVGESGTGGGFKKFCRGEVDLAGASRPIKASEAADCKTAGIDFVELPVAYDGLAIVVHKDNTFVDKLTVAELKAIWSADSKINNWKDVRPGFPDKELKLFGPGVDSGTYDYFTQAVNEKEHSSRGDFTANEDDNVLVQGVAGDPRALGYFGFAYYAENKDRLKLVPIDNGNPADGDGAILPTVETIANGTYQPLARPIFVYVSVKSLARPEVAKLATYYADQARVLSADVGYVALPEAADKLARERLTARKPGSMFEGGSKIGVTVEQLLAAESK